MSENNTYNNIIESSGINYSRLIGWEVWNFMTIEHAKVTFDESNILNFKGYNSAGKSTMLRALDVALFNIKPNSQVGFIQDDKEYFRVMVYFDDDIILLRDKYINGQSLYELYKGSEVIFTTKQNGHLTKVSEVPQPIADYLGLISHNGIILNSRSCFEKQLLVMTSGSENYGFLNSVLKSEELAVASEALNVDKNKLSGEIELLETQLAVYRDSYKESDKMTEEIMTELKNHDSLLDSYDSRKKYLDNISSAYSSIKAIPDIPELKPIDSGRLDLICKIQDLTQSLRGIPDLPEVPIINYNKLDLLSSIKSAYNNLESIPEIPEIWSIDTKQLDLLSSISKAVNDYNSVCAEIDENNKELEGFETTSKELVAVMNEFGRRYTRCTNCGALIEVGAGHED